MKPKPRLQVDIGRRSRARIPAPATLVRWATAALGQRAAGCELALNVVPPAEIRRLNQQYRGKDQPTNVLSFPAGFRAPVAAQAAQPLGDIVICPAVLRAEARAQGKSERAHWAHLVVHGALHLIGYDHERDADARRMERREIAVLRRLGFPNPYRLRPAGLAR